MPESYSAAGERRISCAIPRQRQRPSAATDTDVVCLVALSLLSLPVSPTFSVSFSPRVLRLNQPSNDKARAAQSYLAATRPVTETKHMDQSTGLFAPLILIQHYQRLGFL